MADATRLDYLTWARDPEPPALGRGLRSIGVRARPPGDTLEITLSWEVTPPTVLAALQIAGFPLTPEVVWVQARELAAAA